MQDSRYRRIGVIAGGGEFPLLFSKGVKEKGMEVVAILIREASPPELENYCPKVYQVSLGEVARIIGILRENRVKEVVFGGKIPKDVLFKGIHWDEEAQRLLKRAKDRGDETLLRTFAARLKEEGIKVISGAHLLEGFIAPRGTLTTSHPTSREWEDIKFVHQIARELAGLDIGQTVVVKDKTILAVESIEGTDATIRRGARYGGEGVVVVKVARPHQDMRFDPPVIGTETIKVLEENQASVLAIDGGKTMILNREKTVALAEEAGICIVGL